MYISRTPTHNKYILYLYYTFKLVTIWSRRSSLWRIKIVENYLGSALQDRAHKGCFGPQPLPWSGIFRLCSIVWLQKKNNTAFPCRKSAALVILRMWRKVGTLGVWKAVDDGGRGAASWGRTGMHGPRPVVGNWRYGIMGKGSAIGIHRGEHCVGDSRSVQLLSQERRQCSLLCTGMLR